MEEIPSRRHDARAWIVAGFRVIEDVVYVGLGVLLACSSLALLISGGYEIARSILGGTLTGRVTELLDRILLILLIVELLYTVQVSFREHAIVPEPFLIVGLIAAIRRVLVLTAEFGEAHDKPPDAIKLFVIELAALTVLIFALVHSIATLRKKAPRAAAERA
jgi:uncharacterized membrane protein (DUF373 family)